MVELSRNFIPTNVFYLHIRMESFSHGIKILLVRSTMKSVKSTKRPLLSLTFDTYCTKAVVSICCSPKMKLSVCLTNGLYHCTSLVNDWTIRLVWWNWISILATQTLRKIELSLTPFPRSACSFFNTFLRNGS